MTMRKRHSLISIAAFLSAIFCILIVWTMLQAASEVPDHYINDQTSTSTENERELLQPFNKTVLLFFLNTALIPLTFVLALIGYRRPDSKKWLAMTSMTISGILIMIMLYVVWTTFLG